MNYKHEDRPRYTLFWSKELPHWGSCVICDQLMDLFVINLDQLFNDSNFIELK